MKKIVLFVLAVCAFAPKAFSQELNLPQQNQYLADSEFLIAPTYAGIGDFVRIRLSGVTQWVGVKGAPDYQSRAGGEGRQLRHPRRGPGPGSRRRILRGRDEYCIRDRGRRRRTREHPVPDPLRHAAAFPAGRRIRDRHGDGRIHQGRHGGGSPVRGPLPGHHRRWCPDGLQRDQRTAGDVQQTPAHRRGAQGRGQGRGSAGKVRVG